MSETPETYPGLRNPVQLPSRSGFSSPERDVSTTGRKFDMPYDDDPREEARRASELVGLVVVSAIAGMAFGLGLVIGWLTA